MAALELQANPEQIVPAADICEVPYIDEALVRAVAAQMPEDSEVQRAGEIFKVLNDPTRVKVVFALSQAELCVCDLAALVGISISAVSHQVRLLRALGLVTYRRAGRLAYYSLADEHTVRLLRDTLAHVQSGVRQATAVSVTA